MLESLYRKYYLAKLFFIRNLLYVVFFHKKGKGKHLKGVYDIKSADQFEIALESVVPRVREHK